MTRLLVFATKPKVLRQAKALGFEVLNFDKPERVDAERRAAADHAEAIDWTNPADYLGKAMRLHLEKPLAAVVAFGEYTVYPAALVKEHFGLAGNPLGPVFLANEKPLLRQRLEALPDYGVRFVRVAARPDDRVAAATLLADRLGLPLIIKPTNGSGSRGVSLCRDLADIQDYLGAWDGKAPLLAEEFLDGPELSVEAFSAFGQHQILQITTKETTGAPAFIETGHRQPADLGPGAMEAIRTCVTGLLDLIGHELGPTHTEIRLTPNGPRIIETHTRPGGDGIADLTELTTGVDVFLETLKVLKAICTTSYEEARRRYVPPAVKSLTLASSQFFLWEPQKVAAVDGLDEARATPGLIELVVEAKVGAVLPAPVDSQTRHGHFLVTAPAPGELEERIARIRRLVRVRS